MKTLLLVALAVFPSLAWADSSPTTTAPNPLPPQPTEELKVMTERLNLSRSQQDAIAPILVREANQRKSVQDDTKMSDQQKHDQIGVIHRAALQQIKALFTPEQMALINQGMNHPQPSPTNPSTTSTSSGTQN